MLKTSRRAARRHLAVVTLASAALALTACAPTDEADSGTDAGSGSETSATLPTPPPTVSGMNTSSAQRLTTSIVVARPSWEAEMSRKVSSSAPSTSRSR